MPRSALPVSISLALALLTGCSATFSTTPSTISTFDSTPGTLRGIVHGGRQPIVGAKVFLYENNTTANAGPGLAPISLNKSISLLQTGTGVMVDTTATDITYGDSYVLTGTNGGFTLPAYTCDAHHQVYILALGGKPDGETENPAAANMSALGTCPSSGSFLGVIPTINLNEVSTVALAYAAAGYMSDAAHLSILNSTLATTGIANAVANAAQLFDTSTLGVGALSITPNGQGTVPQQLLNSLANTLAACVNSGGSASSQCSTLFADTTLPANTPTDTASAAINLAHSPARDVTTLLELPSAIGYPFQPYITGLTDNPYPADLTVAIAFKPIPGTASQTISVNGQPPVIDGAGNVWLGLIPGYNPNPSIPTSGEVLRYTPLGASTAYVLPYPNWIAISPSDLAWVTNLDPNGVQGTIVIGPDGATPTVLAADSDFPNYIAFDKYGQAWVNNSYIPTLSLYSSGSTPAETAAFSLTKTSAWQFPAPDHTGHINAFGYDSATGNTSISQSSYIGGTLTENILDLDDTDYSYATGSFVADSSDNLWIYTTQTSDSTVILQEFSNAGVLQHSYPGPYGAAQTNAPQVIAFDGSGNAWAANNFYLTEQNGATILSPAGSGFGGGNGSGAIPSPVNAAVDGSGNVWVLTADASINFYLTEVIGAATPVVTPISPNNPSGSGTTGLAVRP